jgi:copper resistance protein D
LYLVDVKGIIPVLVFAIINGILSKKAATIPCFNPGPWIKAESYIILIVFYFNSVLGISSS